VRCVESAIAPANVPRSGIGAPIRVIACSRGVVSDIASVEIIATIPPRSIASTVTP
jgi:hypothetical protein